MYAFSLLSFLAVICTVRANAACDISQHPENKLKNDLMCTYDPKVRPVKDHTKNVTVAVRLILRYFEYEPFNSAIALDTWMVLLWYDEHLTWKPQDYSGLEFLQLSSEDIWIPDLSVYNKRDRSEDPSLAPLMQCSVSNVGRVYCVVSTRIEALCVADLSRFPFDEQTCKVIIGSWVHNGERMHVVIGEPPYSYTGYVSNGEWNIKSLKVTKDPGIFKSSNETYPSIHYTFLINRLTGPHTATIIIPAVVIIIITLTSLWLSPLNSERMLLCCVNLLTGSLYLQYVSVIIPLKGENTPYLVLFARDSLLLCGFSIFLTVLLKNIATYKHDVPAWISASVGLIVSNPVGKWIFIADNSAKGVALAKGEQDGEAIVDSSDSNETTSKPSSEEGWLVFSKIIDRFCFIIYCIVYIGMFLSYSP